MDILRQLQQGKVRAGQNILPYSSYSSSGWTVDSGSPTDEGAVSMGNSGWHQIGNTDNTVTTYGTQSWSAAAAVRWKSSVLDVSGYSTLLTRVRVGLWQGSQQTVTASIAIGDTFGGAVGTVTKTVGGNVELYSRVTVSDISDPSTARVWLTVTPQSSDEIWWWDWAQVVGDPSSTFPETWVESTGSAVNRTSDEVQYKVLLVCPKCVDTRIDIINEYDYDPAEPPEIDEDLEVE